MKLQSCLWKNNPPNGTTLQYNSNDNANQYCCAGNIFRMLLDEMLLRLKWQNAIHSESKKCIFEYHKLPGADMGRVKLIFPSHRNHELVQNFTAKERPLGRRLQEFILYRLSSQHPS